MLEPAVSRVRVMLGAAGSLRVTPFALLALAGAALLDYRDVDAGPAWMLAPLALLAVNLGAALLTDPRLRLRAPLLLFHVALLVVLVLAGVAELLRFSGRVELVDGAAFDADAVIVDRAGPLHRLDWLRAADLRQQGFSVDYQPGLAPGSTRSWLAAGEDPVLVEVGNTRPLVSGGYRFHTTSNKGFAALVEWRDAGGAQLGAVHFPSWPLHDWNQVARWVAPGGESLVLELQVPLRADAVAGFVLDSRQAGRGGSVRVRDGRGELLAELSPGASVAVGEGRLLLAELRMWMGYTVSFDPLLAWLLGVALVGIAALGVHFHGRYAPTPVSAGVAVTPRSSVGA